MQEPQALWITESAKERAGALDELGGEPWDGDRIVVAGRRVMVVHTLNQFID